VEEGENREGEEDARKRRKRWTRVGEKE